MSLFARDLCVLPVCLGILMMSYCASSHAEEDTKLRDELRASITKTLPLLTKAAKGHREERTCFACHNQGVSILAIVAAKARGFEIDADELQQQLQHTAAFLATGRENYLQGKGQGGRADMAGSALLALAAGKWKPDETTAAVAEYLLKYQAEADHWSATSQRPPSEASDFTTSFVALRGLAEFGTPEQSERIVARKKQVHDWFLKEPVKDNEDRVFRLWGMQSAGGSADELKVIAKELADKQQADGGWSQLDTGDAPFTQSDAYATGTALVALHQAGGMASSDPVYQRGLAYLLKTQQADGSWQIPSRSKPFQKYFETGFPHGKDQFISCAATGWGTMAMILAFDLKSEPAEPSGGQR